MMRSTMTCPRCGTATFFLVVTYILKARGLGSARQLGSGVFDWTVLISRSP
jgi:hypothetical protein